MIDVAHPQQPSPVGLSRKHLDLALALRDQHSVLATLGQATLFGVCSRIAVELCGIRHAVVELEKLTDQIERATAGGIVLLGVE